MEGQWSYKLKSLSQNPPGKNPLSTDYADFTDGKSIIWEVPLNCDIGLLTISVIWVDRKSVV